MGMSESEFKRLEAQVASNMVFRPPSTSRPGNHPYTAPTRQSGMNKWESEYAQELEMRRRVGEIRWFGFEAIKLRLADATYYTPDFTVIRIDRPIIHDVLELHECKGFWRDDAICKFKIAAELFPWARFLALRKKKVKEGGGWEVIKDLNA